MGTELLSKKLTPLRAAGLAGSEARNFRKSQRRFNSASGVEPSILAGVGGT